MKRKIVSAILILAICLSMAFTVSAESQTIDFVIDEFGNLAADELKELTALALNIYQQSGVGIFFVYTTVEPLEDYDIAALTGGMEDYFVMIENDTSWSTFKSGKGEEIDLAAEDELRAVYNADETYAGGVREFLNAAALYFPYIADTPEGDILTVEEYLIFDDADLLSDSEEVSLTGKMIDISHKYDAQIVICTIASMDSGDIDGFLNYLYDSMGFGYGENHDGVLLLVCMDPREYRILSNGFAGSAIDPDDIDSIGDVIVSDLSDGDYADAFEKFIDECDYYLDGYINGFPFPFAKALLICLLIGFAAGGIVAMILKGQLISVQKQNQANVYVKPGSMQLTMHNDVFLYSNVTRTKKSSGGSSGSDSSRSTGGGSF